MKLVSPDDSVLRKKTTDINVIPEYLEDMFGVLESKGIGLAAPQVGKTDRIFIMKFGDEKFVCMSPEIMDVSDETDSREEGCLSIPGQRVDVIRPSIIHARYHDGHNVVERHLEGIQARCFQHELDHLNGVLMVDYLSRLKRNMAMKKAIKQYNES